MEATMSNGVSKVRLTQQLHQLQASLGQLLPEAQAAGALGAPGGQVLAALDDLSATLAELQAAEAAESQAGQRPTVEDERRYYYELFDTAPDAYVVTDINGR